MLSTDICYCNVLQGCLDIRQTWSIIPELSSALLNLLGRVSLSSEIVNFELGPEVRDAEHYFPYSCLQDQRISSCVTLQTILRCNKVLVRCITIIRCRTIVLKVSAGLARALSSTSLGEYLGEMVTRPATTSTSCQQQNAVRYARDEVQTQDIQPWFTARRDMQLACTHLILLIQFVPAEWENVNA